MNLTSYKKELEEELGRILHYWMNVCVDDVDGGFYGRIDGDNKVIPEASKGVVLNSRILWTFSAAAHSTKEPSFLPVAQRAYTYLLDHFLDKTYGGVYWSLDHRGAPLNDRKQIYGLAFCLYGFSEYYRATGQQGVLDEAIRLFRLIERYSYDHERKGYYEAFARDWAPLEDWRLSGKDANVPKTMNTHLHILEAYGNLYRVWPDPLLLAQIKGLLEVFFRYMIAETTGHLILFFEEDWTVRSSMVSYGHDVEAAWLLQEAATIIGDGEWIEKTGQLALKMALAAAEGLDTNGGLWYERGERGLAETAADHLVREKHWWPQAEAMIGFFNAWQAGGDEIWLQRSLASWEFVKNYIRDSKGGEWWWGVDAQHSPMPGQDKAGFWKCPYHNGRACMEIIRRLNILM